MEQRTDHPLDIDLLDVVLGEADVALTDKVSVHLVGCLLCRIRVGRLRRANLSPGALVATGAVYPTISPEVLAIVDESAPMVPIAANQLRLAGVSHRVLLWVSSIDDRNAYVHGAYIDTDAAEDTTLLAFSATLDRLVGVSGSVSAAVPLSAVGAFVDTLDIQGDLRRVIQSSVTGEPVTDLMVGPPITGPSDERLEFRQLLGEDVHALRDLDGDPPDTGDRASGQPDAVLVDIWTHLFAEVTTARNGRCRVHHVGAEVQGPFADRLSLTPLALLHESELRILVLTGEIDELWVTAEADAAYDLCLEADVSTMMVASSVFPHDTRVFERSSLRLAREQSSGAVLAPPRSFWPEPIPLAKAVREYLQIAAFRSGLPPVEVRPAPAPPDVGPRLQPRAREVIAELSARRAQLGKLRALRALSQADADLIAGVLQVPRSVDATRAELDRITDR